MEHDQYQSMFFCVIQRKNGSISIWIDRTGEAEFKIMLKCYLQLAVTSVLSRNDNRTNSKQHEYVNMPKGDYWDCYWLIRTAYVELAQLSPCGRLIETDCNSVTKQQCSKAYTNGVNTVDPMGNISNQKTLESKQVNWANSIHAADWSPDHDNPRSNESVIHAWAGSLLIRLHLTFVEKYKKVGEYH